MLYDSKAIVMPSDGSLMLSYPTFHGPCPMSLAIVKNSMVQTGRLGKISLQSIWTQLSKNMTTACWWTRQQISK